MTGLKLKEKCKCGANNWRITIIEEGEFVNDKELSNAEYFLYLYHTKLCCVVCLECAEEAKQSMCWLRLFETSTVGREFIELINDRIEKGGDVTNEEIKGAMRERIMETFSCSEKELLDNVYSPTNVTSRKDLTSEAQQVHSFVFTWLVAWQKKTNPSIKEIEKGTRLKRDQTKKALEELIKKGLLISNSEE